MEVVYQRCCGIDVHKKMIVACFRDGRKKELREFGTLTSDLRELTNWLLEEKCEMIAMESTASYWKPLYNLFELSGLPAMVVNAQHMKSLPGRKTDMKDAEWISDLLLCQTYTQWNTSRKTAYFSLGCAVFVFACAIAVFFLK